MSSPLGQLSQPPVKPGFFPSRLQPSRVISRRAATYFAKRHRKQLKILEHNGKDRLIFLILVFSDIDAIEQDFALRRIIQAAKQLDKRGFARSVLLTTAKRSPAVNFNRNMPQRPLAAARILKANIANSLSYSLSPFSQNAVFPPKRAVVISFGISKIQT